MERAFMVTPLGDGIFRCINCGTRLASVANIISTDFHCMHGTAYHFDQVVNISIGGPSIQSMVTGRDVVEEIYCVKCGSVLGWKYKRAFLRSQKHMEGTFVIERSKLSFIDNVEEDENDSKDD